VLVAGLLGSARSWAAKFSDPPSQIIAAGATGQLGTPARTGKEGMQADATVSRPATVSAHETINPANIVQPRAFVIVLSVPPRELPEVSWPPVATETARARVVRP
jgi:hypothetical protein